MENRGGRAEASGALDIQDYYAEKIQTADKEIKRYERLINTYSFLRLFVLALGIFLLYQTVKFEKVWLTELSFIVMVLGFAWLVSRQSKYTRIRDFFISLKKINLNEVESINRHTNIYSNGAEWADELHTYTSDLDIFGNGSLYNLLNRTASPPARKMLAQWLSGPGKTPDIIRRQEAVKELKGSLDWVQDFKAVLLFAKDTKDDEIKSLYNYLDLAPEIVSPILKTYIKYVPFVFAFLAALVYFLPFLSAVLTLLIVVNAVLVISHQLKVNKADRLIFKAGKTLAGYAESFSLIENRNWNSGLLSDLSADLQSKSGTALSSRVKQLGVLAGRLEVRLNMFVGPLVNGIMAWDVRQLIAIESWKAKNREQLERAFEVIATYESLLSLCSIHTNYPSWCFPEIDERKRYTYVTENVGHPLIFKEQRVDNDYSLDDQLRIDIITGSNMAGKSTFLRTLGINAVLALAGSPVCASKMKVSNMLVFTYMRIKDSLNEHTSTFKAELNRLQLLLEVLEREEKVYFLIDEMLRGTNSADKYLGSKAVIEKLLKEDAVGIVATHDLQIARLEDKYPAYVRNFYFDIQIADEEMYFDYKLKDGECKTFNASQLLRRLGIDVSAD